MTPDERRARLQRILDEHDRMSARLREVIEAVREGRARMEDSHAAANEAIAFMLAANREAVALWNQETE